MAQSIQAKTRVIMPVWCINEQILNLTDLAIQSLGDVELIIIDNGSTMGGGQLREWADIYIRNKENLGYAKAVNQGLKLCDKGEIIAIANNDIRVSPNWQEVALETLQDPKIGSLHFRMIPYTEDFNLGSDTWVGGKERWCTSSFFVVRNVQLYDEEYLNSIEDWDFWKRMRDQGYIQAYTNQVEYQHMDSFTQQFNPQRAEVDKKNREHFKTKFGLSPEEDFEKSFPGELSKVWRPFP